MQVLQVQAYWSARDLISMPDSPSKIPGQPQWPHTGRYSQARVNLCSQGAGSGPQPTPGPPPAQRRGDGTGRKASPRNNHSRERTARDSQSSLNISWHKPCCWMKGKPLLAAGAGFLRVTACSCPQQEDLREQEDGSWPAPCPKLMHKAVWGQFAANGRAQGSAHPKHGAFRAQQPPGGKGCSSPLSSW